MREREREGIKKKKTKKRVMWLQFEHGSERKNELRPDASQIFLFRQKKFNI